MAEWIKTTGERETVAPKKPGKKKFTLEELQGFVGGYIELVYLPKRQKMIVNEEGRIHGLPLNRVASEMTASVILGDVLICGPGEM